MISLSGSHFLSIYLKMHSTGVLSSLLLAAAAVMAAPAPQAPAYTADAPLVKPSGGVVSEYAPSYTPDAPYDNKPSTTLSTSTTTSSYAAPPTGKPEGYPSPKVSNGTSSSYTTSTYTSTSTSTKGAPTPTPSYGGKPSDGGNGKDYPSGGDSPYDIPNPAEPKPNPRSGDMDLIAKLMVAPTQQDRVRLLQEPGDFVFDFNDSGAPEGSESAGKGGFTVAATARTFPALIGNGGAMTVGFLGPCAMNTPHVHNRATELNIVVEGRLVTNFQVENGLPSMSNVLNKYQMTVFPQGAIHQEFNPDCEDAVFVAGFNNVDPGVEQIAQTFFGLRPDVVAATLGGVYQIEGADLESFRDRIPANVALGVEQCLQKCGIQKNAKRSVEEVFGLAA